MNNRLTIAFGAALALACLSLAPLAQEGSGLPGGSPGISQPSWASIPTAQFGTSTNQAASTAFVQGAVGPISGSAITAITGDLSATGPGAVAGTLATVNANVGSFGSSTSIPNLTVNAKGLVTAAGGNVVIAPAGTLSGTSLNTTVVNSSLTSVGTLVGGGTGAGFTVALGTSTITGSLPCANHPVLTGDVTTSNCAATLATVNGGPGSIGSSTAIPVLTTNGKGLVTTQSTAVVIAPAGTLSGTALNSTVVGSSLTSVGTLGSLAVSGGATVGSLNSLTVTTSTGTLTIANAKTLTANNSLTFTGTDGSSVALGTGGTVTYTIASGATALATGAIASATCTSAQTATATGALTTDVLTASFNGDPTAVTGYVPLTTGMLTIIAYPTANTANFKVCNNTNSSITPGAVTINWRVVR